MIEVNQVILNRVWHHLLCQRRKSETRDPIQPYALCGLDGRRDAMGCLIDRDSYRPSLEGYPPSGEEVICAVADSLGCDAEEIDRELARGLVLIHDTCDVSEWQDRLELLAIKHELQVPPAPGLWDRICHWFDRQIAANRDFSGFDY